MVHVFLLQSACLNNPCKNNGTCQTGFTDRGYRCVCTAGFEGHNCQRGKLTRKQEKVEQSLVSYRRMSLREESKF